MVFVKPTGSLPVPLDLIFLLSNTVDMSCLSFKTFCIELYADRKSLPSNEVYTLFEKNGIIKMLDEDYEILHGHGFDYILCDIDQLLENGGI